MARRSSKTLSLRVSSKKVFTVVAIIVAVAFILYKFAAQIAPLIGVDTYVLKNAADKIYTGGVALFFFWLAFMTMAFPILAIAFAIIALGAVYHLWNKF